MEARGTEKTTWDLQLQDVPEIVPLEGALCMQNVTEAGGKGYQLSPNASGILPRLYMESWYGSRELSDKNSDKYVAKIRF